MKYGVDRVTPLVSLLRAGFTVGFPASFAPRAVGGAGVQTHSKSSM